MYKLIAVLFFNLTALNSAFASSNPDILGIFDQFVTSSAATSKCDKPSVETLTKFRANLQMVSVLASKKLKEQYPKTSKENIEKAMKKRTEQIAVKVGEIVDKNGCDNPDVQEIIKRFYVQAKWKPGQ